MCGKMGASEVDSVRNMMALAVYFAVSDVFEVDAMGLSLTTDFEKDLHASPEMKNKLYESVRELFNGVELDCTCSCTIQDIVDQVVSVDEVLTLH